jgi:hypothetical protein
LHQAGERPGHRQRALGRRVEQLRQRDEPGAREGLQEWVVSPRVNCSGVGDNAPTMIEPAEID